MNKQEERGAHERTRQLLEDMPGRRKALLAMLAFLRQAHSPEDLRDEVARVQAHDASAFSAGSYSFLLEEAGAIERLSPDGSPFQSQTRWPLVVEDNGGRYFKPGPKLEFVWHATKAGLEVLEENEPVALTQRLIESNGKFVDLYARILRLCDEEERCIEAINACVDYDPLVQDPPLKASYFVEGLEGSGALTWQGSWKTTTAGHAWLAAHIDTTDGE